MSERAHLPFVAIVGRPNVGKSTLFNRLARRRLAIVEDVPGVTRDRHYADTEWGDRRFTLIDTGGFVPDDRDVLDKAVRDQARAAVEECDVIIFVTDARAGRTGTDEQIARELRKSGKPIFLAVNKVDGSKQESLAADFAKLGFPQTFDVSAEHGRGVETLVGAVIDALPESEPIEAPQEGTIRLAIIGRPNVGKSTLVNALLGEERLITSAVAGTTRDAIDSELEHQGKRFILTDTAGIRRKATIAQKVEHFAVLQALKSVEKSDVAVLVLDATEPGVDQDAHIAGVAEEKGCPLVIVVNKWDLLQKTPHKERAFREELKYKLKFVSHAPIVFTSALHAKKVDKVLELAAQLHEQNEFRAPTPQLNKLLDHITTEHPAPFAHGRALRLYYCAQVAARPPTFTFMCNMPNEVPDRYKRYIVNQLRKTFGLKVPIRIYFRERPGQAKRAERVRQMKARTEKRRRR